MLKTFTYSYLPIKFGNLIPLSIPEYIKLYIPLLKNSDSVYCLVLLEPIYLINIFYSVDKIHKCITLTEIRDYNFIFICIVMDEI